MKSHPLSALGRRRFLTLSAAAALAPRSQVAAAPQESMIACLQPGIWEKVESTVDAALAAIAAAPGPNGELGLGESHPASTAMCVMAFLSRGHAPGHGKYGEILEKAVDSVMACQDFSGAIGFRSGNGLTYMHAMSGLMLGEVYGRTRHGQSLRIREAIIKALAVTRKAQSSIKATASHKGGVRYFNNLTDSDLSVTGWHFMFYRSAKNAEFDVPEAWVIEMLQFVYACKFGEDGFGYQPGRASSFAMTAVGLLCMTMAGKNDHPLAAACALALQKYPLQSVQDPNGFNWGGGNRIIYGMYYASLATAQMGGEYWKLYYPRLVHAHLSAPRNAQGMWEHQDMGMTLDTAFRILSLTPPCQLLPIFQR
jgi:hypothetical protein